MPRSVSKFNYNLVYSYAAQVIINACTPVIVPKPNPKLNYNLVNSYIVQVTRKKTSEKESK